MRPDPAGYGRFLTFRRRVQFGGSWPSPVVRRRSLRLCPRGHHLPSFPEGTPARTELFVTAGGSRVFLWRSRPGDFGEGETRTGSWELVPRAQALHGASGDASAPNGGGGGSVGYSRRRISWRRNCPGFTWVLSNTSSLRLPSRIGNTAFSISASSFQYDQRKEFSLEQKTLYFDTHALVRLLEEHGFATQQSEVIVSALLKIINSNKEVVYKDMVTKMQQEISLQQIMSHIASVKKDMIILEKSEFSALRTENEDEVVKLQADNKLDFNLEKSRVKEMYAENERKLLEIRSEIVGLHAQQDRGLTQTNRKIDTEVAGLRTMMESHKLDTIKYLAGSVFTCLTIALGFYRLWI